MSRRPAATSAAPSQSRLDQVLAAGFAKLQLEQSRQEDTDVRPVVQPAGPQGGLRVVPTIPAPNPYWEASLANGQTVVQIQGQQRFGADLRYIYQGKFIEFRGGVQIVPAPTPTSRSLEELLRPNIFQGTTYPPNLTSNGLPDFIYRNVIEPERRQELNIGWTQGAGPLVRGEFWWDAVTVVDGANVFYNSGGNLWPASVQKMETRPLTDGEGRKPQIMFIKEETWRDNLLDPAMIRAETLRSVGPNARPPYPYGEDVPIMSAKMVNYFGVQLPPVNAPVCKTSGFNLVVVVVGLKPCVKDQAGNYVEGVPGSTNCYRRQGNNCALVHGDGEVKTFEHRFCEFDDYLASEFIHYMKSKCKRSTGNGNFTNDIPGQAGSNIGLQSRDNNILKPEANVARYLESFVHVADGMRVRVYRFNITSLQNRLDERNPDTKQRERPGEEPQSSRDGAQQGGGKRRA